MQSLIVMLVTHLFHNNSIIVIVCINDPKKTKLGSKREKKFLSSKKL